VSGTAIAPHGGCDAQNRRQTVKRIGYSRNTSLLLPPLAASNDGQHVQVQ
jgi:hypothetical protein